MSHSLIPRPCPEKSGIGPGQTCKKFPYVLCQQSLFGVDKSHSSITIIDPMKASFHNYVRMVTICFVNIRFQKCGVLDRPPLSHPRICLYYLLAKICSHAL